MYWFVSCLVNAVFLVCCTNKLDFAWRNMSLINSLIYITSRKYVFEAIIIIFIKPVVVRHTYIYFFRILFRANYYNYESLNWRVLGNLFQCQVPWTVYAAVNSAGNSLNLIAMYMLACNLLAWFEAKVVGDFGACRLATNETCVAILSFYFFFCYKNFILWEFNGMVIFS